MPAAKQTDLPVLVIDDEPDIRELIEVTLIKMGLSVETAGDVTQAKTLLSKKQFALALTDMRLPDGMGLEIVQYIQDKNLDVPIAVITAHGSAENAVDAMKAGAFDYLQKPVSLNQLRTLVKSALDLSTLPAATTTPAAPAVEKPKPVVKKAATATSSPEPVKAADAPQGMRLIGNAPAMQEARQLITKLARTQASVYIFGESGTGKEQAARSIHELSPRARAPFVPVNCGAIPENLVESEFFGYRKGAFTGADSDRDGFFQQASGGTLFLDEVADLPLTMQVKLLRAIQEKSVRKIGSASEAPVDIRILCATHKNLADEVTAGRFRQDLYFRLNVITLKMPPLRELREDIPRLIKMLLERYATGGQPPRLAPAALKSLLAYNYPGNFRELENILERAVALAGDELIDVNDLQLLAMQETHVDSETGEQVVLTQLDGRETLQDFLDRVERDAITKALESTRYNRTQAAKLLGISFRSLRYRLERLGIE